MSQSPTKDRHRAVLATLPTTEWDDYLDANSGLPGPRGNLELLEVVGDIASPQYLRSCAASLDEYRAAVGAAGLGRLATEGDTTVLGLLHELAQDPRWRVREGVAMALQRIGDADRSQLHQITETWAGGPPLVQRAAVAGECEPRLLDTGADAAHALGLVDRVTASLVELPPSRRREDDVRVLRKALGYCWSVATAAAPDEGFAALERWAGVADADVAWVLRENVRKARLTRADAARTAHLAARLG